MEDEKEETKKKNKEEMAGAIYVTPNSEGLSGEDQVKYGINNLK